MGWKMVYNFLGNDEKNTEKSLLTSLWKRSRTFLRAVYQNKNHVTLTPAPVVSVSIDMAHNATSSLV